MRQPAATAREAKGAACARRKALADEPDAALRTPRVSAEL